MKPDGIGRARTRRETPQDRPDNLQMTDAMSRLQQALTRDWAQGDVLAAIVDVIPDYIFVKDRDSRFVVANAAVAADVGRTSGAELFGLTDFELHDIERARGFFEREQHVMQTGKAQIDFEENIVGADGHEKWLLTSKIPLRDTCGTVIGVVGISRDFTERRQADLFATGQADVLEMIATNRPLPEILTRVITLIEGQMPGVTGSILMLDRDGLHLRPIAGPNIPPALSRLVDGFPIGPLNASCGTAAYTKQPVICADVEADPRWTDYRALLRPFGYRACWSTPILSRTGVVLATYALYLFQPRLPTPREQALISMTAKLVGIAVERSQAEERIHFMALHDPLTSLPNRSLLKQRLAEAIARPGTRRLAIVFIDLDNFKIVNDSLGHGAGDQLLSTVAGRMQESLGPHDTVARVGGDEFVVLYGDPPEAMDDMIAMVDRLRGVIAEPLRLVGKSFSCSASVGLALYPRDGQDADTLLSNADSAMYQAKSFGRDNVQTFRHDLREAVEDKLTLSNALKTAIAGNEFRLVYQPQVDFRTGRIIAVEALLRWIHPRLGPISPERFIPLAEATGTILPIGDWVLYAACRQAAAWTAAGAPPVTLCVNISAHQFRLGLLERQVTGALAASGFDPHFLELELTESMLMHDEVRSIATMEELRRLGVRFAIDDFGTGYSSFSSLKRFPVARIKIDKTFVRDLDHDENDRAITAAMILMAQKLNLRVVAEGVETEGQHRFLAENGCDEAQGYRYSRPVSGLGLGRLLKAGAGIDWRERANIKARSRLAG